MKTKEQLAEAYCDKMGLFPKSNAYEAFLAGYDARDAQLSKTPEFDEVRIAKVSFEECSNFQTDLQGHNNDRFYFEKGARWQFQECAKVLAASDLKIESLNEERDSIHANGVGGWNAASAGQVEIEKLQAERDIYLKALEEIAVSGGRDALTDTAKVSVARQALENYRKKME